jgi:hypothetical protein
MSYRTQRFVGLMVLGLALCASWTLAADTDKGLQYRFKAGETYVYAVNIVGEIGPATETTTGQIQFTVKSVDATDLHLTPFVAVTTKTVGQPARRPLFPRRPPIIGFARPRAAPDLHIDSYGKILKVSGETSLPLLMGYAEQLVIEPLSKGKKQWQEERSIAIVDSKDAKTPAKETANYEVTSSTGSMIKIKKTYELKMDPKGKDPQIEMAGTTEIVFDAGTGMIKSGEFKGAITVSEKNVTVKIPVTASYRLMTAEEVATLKKEAETARIKAQEAAKEAARPKPISDADLTRAIADVKGGGFKGAQGADRLAKAIPVEARRKEVVEALTAAAKSKEEGFLCPAAAKALKGWATPQDVNTFLELLNDKNVWVRKAAFEGLGELKDPKGAEVVAQKMTDFFQRGDAIASLKAMGKVAEKPVLGLLNEKDWGVRAEACKLLGTIGTKESLPALKKAQTDSNGFVAKEAEKAIKALDGK